jgi:predicted transcriptional regulator
MELVSTGKVYKGLEVYSCLALNRIAAQLGIDLLQSDLELKLDTILKNRGDGIPKVDISYELRANHHMTNKVLEVLEEEELIEIQKEEEGREYRVRITKKGVLHLRKFNEFYSVIFKRYILDHYKYSNLPAWFIQG